MRGRERARAETRGPQPGERPEAVHHWVAQAEAVVRRQGAASRAEPVASSSVEEAAYLHWHSHSTRSGEGWLVEQPTLLPLFYA